jgi:hypothetical protein
MQASHWEAGNCIFLCALDVFGVIECPRSRILAFRIPRNLARQGLVLVIRTLPLQPPRTGKEIFLFPSMDAQMVDRSPALRRRWRVGVYCSVTRPGATSQGSKCCTAALGEGCSFTPVCRYTDGTVQNCRGASDLSVQGCAANLRLRRCFASRTGDSAAFMAISED